MSGRSRTSSSENLFSRRYGCVLRVRGRTLQSIPQRQAGGGGRAPPRAWRGFGGVLCGAPVLSPLGHAAADGVSTVPTGHYRGRPSGTLPRVLAKSLRSAALVFAAGRNGLNR